MHLHDLNGRSVCILGFGREGQATLHAIQKYAPGADVTVADRDEGSPTRCQLSGIGFQVGKQYLQNLDRFDVVIKSPGIPPKELPSPVPQCTSATQIFFDSIADSGATVIGITGSKGKSTTASLIHKILEKSSCHPERSRRIDTMTYQPYLIGNIGSPAIDFFDKAKPGTTFVMELSSYQLMDLTVSPHIAIITSFFPEHLDYHGSLEAYREAKRNICRFQKEDDIVFYSALIPPSPPSRGRGQGEGAYAIATVSPGKRVPFSEDDAPVKLEETELLGHHNLSNIAAAWKVAEYLGISRDVAIQAIQEFQPLPHRLQSLGIHHGIDWVDDAISTTPESTIAALDALGDRVITIILGGLDRGYDFTTLAERIVSSAIQTVILFPGSGPRIREAIEKRILVRDITFFEANTMEEAVSFAERETNNEQRTTKNPIVLLSTASPSYNMFKNFEEKGNCFQKTILR